jgi:hypothetical protein
MQIALVRALLDEVERAIRNDEDHLGAALLAQLGDHFAELALLVRAMLVQNDAPAR